MKKSLLCLFLLAPTLASAAEADPRTAPRMKLVNTTVISYEHSRWDQIAKWKEAEDTLQTAEKQRDFRRRQFERGKELVASDTITKQAYSLLMYEYQCSELELKRLRAEATRAKQLALAYRAMAEAEEASTPALLREILDAQLSAERAHTEILRLSLEKSGIERALTKLKLEGGEKLLRTNALSDAEFERRELNVRITEGQSFGWETQIKLSEEKIKSLEELRARVR